MGYGQGRADVGASAAMRTVVLASADADFRQRLRRQLTAMRWDVREAGGGAEAMACLETAGAEILLVDSWLPDLEVGEFAGQMRSRHPAMDLLQIDGGTDESGARSPRRNELLHALRQVQAAASELPVWVGAPVTVPRAQMTLAVVEAPSPMPLPDVIGESAGMRELARQVRLVAPRSTTVLIEGATGTGKELVAHAVHRLSKRSAKPYVVLNCAAIPEALLEAELFGHTRGAFTGAVTSRTGRVEAADGGTLFLDEIGEMPLALQAKMLRFLESGEIQRVGGNETVQVDVRIVAATHQPLKLRTEEARLSPRPVSPAGRISGQRPAPERSDGRCSVFGGFFP